METTDQQARRRRRWRARAPVLACSCSIAALAFFPLGADGGARPASAPKSASAAPALRAALTQARRSGSGEAISAALTQALDQTSRAPGDSGAWVVLAEGHLERVLHRVSLRGLRVGTPFFEELPPEVQHDLDAGMRAVAAARERGADSATLFRIESLLLSMRVTSVFTALRYHGAITRALAAASERDEDAADVQQALGLRKLLSPKLFGHEPEAALRHLEEAARNGSDERSCVYAAMACHLLGQSAEALAWLERAVDTNRANVFALAALARLRAGEDDPFGRDVTPAEAAALLAR